MGHFDIKSVDYQKLIWNRLTVKSRILIARLRLDRDV